MIAFPAFAALVIAFAFACYCWYQAGYDAGRFDEAAERDKVADQRLDNLS